MTTELTKKFRKKMGEGMIIAEIWQAYDKAQTDQFLGYGKLPYYQEHSSTDAERLSYRLSKLWQSANRPFDSLVATLPLLELDRDFKIKEEHARSAPQHHAVLIIKANKWLTIKLKASKNGVGVSVCVNDGALWYIGIALNSQTLKVRWEGKDSLSYKEFLIELYKRANQRVKEIEIFMKNLNETPKKSNQTDVHEISSPLVAMNPRVSYSLKGAWRSLEHDNTTIRKGEN